MVWVAVVFAGGLSVIQASSQVRVNRDAKILKGFGDRVEQYAELHKKLEGTLPHLPDEADQTRVHAHQVALGKLIRQARAQARAGDILDRSTRALLRRLIRAVVRGTGGRQIVAEILDENTQAVIVRVNGSYPSTVPLSSMPAQLLEALPRLPEEVEYRFVGRQLILFDLHAQIIADYMRDALP